jgi:hypothetical protein
MMLQSWEAPAERRINFLRWTGIMRARLPSSSQYLSSSPSSDPSLQNVCLGTKQYREHRIGDRQPLRRDREAQVRDSSLYVTEAAMINSHPLDVFVLSSVYGLNLAVPEDAKAIIKPWDQREDTTKFADSNVDDQVSKSSCPYPLFAC